MVQEGSVPPGTQLLAQLQKIVLEILAVSHLKTNPPKAAWLYRVRRCSGEPAPATALSQRPWKLGQGLEEHLACEACGDGGGRGGRARRYDRCWR